MALVELTHNRRANDDEFPGGFFEGGDHADAASSSLSSKPKLDVAAGLCTVGAMSTEKGRPE